jgi:hypothetical protein
MEDVYGFGALRCAIDNHNGENIEWISYPQQYTHVFCYYYAVTPAPQDGTIVVRKQLGDGSTDRDKFLYEGNVSYNSNPSQGAFDITTSNSGSGEVSFVRGATRTGDPEWYFRELLTGWFLNSIDCTSLSGERDRGARIRIELRVDRLAGRDTVTCTYTDSKPLAQRLVVTYR